MKYFLIVVKKLISKPIQQHLGRWRTETCNKKLNNKIDLSNEDHCGPCGQYVLQKIESKNKKEPNNKIK
jgi:hypothetical protein